MKSGRRRSESSRGLDSLNSFLTLWSLEPRVLARQAGTSSLGSCPCGQQGPHWRVMSYTWAPGDMAALSSETQACLSVPAALLWGQCPDLKSN